MNRVGRFDLIVFDMDGVLTDSSGCHARAFADLWSFAGVTHPPAYPAIAGRSTESVVREFTAASKPSRPQIESWTRYKQERAREYLRTTAAFPDALPVLQALSRQGYQLALGTGASRQTATMLLNQTGLAPLLPVMVTADDVLEGKPNPETYARAIRLANGRPERSLVVEDSAAGLQAGDAAGAATASVRTGETIDHARFIGAFPDLNMMLAAITSDAAKRR
ncbi:MAG: HAD-IA family hydrolase [Gemmatimonadota bacterium]